MTKPTPPPALSKRKFAPRDFLGYGGCSHKYKDKAMNHTIIVEPNKLITIDSVMATGPCWHYEKVRHRLRAGPESIVNLLANRHDIEADCRIQQACFHMDPRATVEFRCRLAAYVARATSFTGRELFILKIVRDALLTGSGLDKPALHMFGCYMTTTLPPESTAVTLIKCTAHSYGSHPGITTSAARLAAREFGWPVVLEIFTRVVAEVDLRGTLTLEFD